MSATRRACFALAATMLASSFAACGLHSTASSGGVVPTTTVPVVRTDIVSRQQLNGTLTYAGSYTLINRAGPGIYTSLPHAGAVVSRGQTLYRVDNRPIPLLYGDPEWRVLSVGVSDGPDVTQLEQNLLSLGFANSSNLIANGHFDSFDAAAIRRWQSALGMTQTGVFNPGDAIFQPGAIRVASVHPTVGMTAQPGQSVIDATTTERVVSMALDVSRESLVKVGDEVVVSLPDSSRVNGSIGSIGTVATSSQITGGPPGPTTIPVTVALSDATAGGSLDQAPVIVNVTDTVHRGVLAVPVMALLAQAGGAYAVEVVEGADRRAIGVTTGLFDDRGLVEVSSPDLREGMLVEVPQT